MERLYSRFCCIGGYMGVTSHDWDTVRLEYVTGSIQADSGLVTMPTAEKLAEKYKVPISFLRKRICEEKWLEQRRTFQEKAYQEALARNTETRALMINEFDMMCEKVATKAIAHIYKLITNCQDDKELTSLLLKFAKPLLDYQKAGRLALSMPTDINGISQEQIKQEIDDAVQSMSVDQLRQALNLSTMETK